MSKNVITDFTFGEISRKSDGRSDLGAYYKSCAELRNMYVTPQGVASRMPGTEFVSSYLGAVSSYATCRLIPFWIDENESYMFVFVPGHLYYYKVDTGVASTLTEIKNSSNQSLVLTKAQIDGFQFTQFNDALYLCHQEIVPVRIKYTAGTPPSLEWDNPGYPSTLGKPGAVTAMQQRLFYANFTGKRDYYAGSKSFDPTNWTWGTTASDPFNYQLSSGRDYSAIRWIAANEDGLVAGTATSEVVIPGGDGGITPSNGGGQRLTSCFGSCNVQALKMGLSLLFVGRTGERLREYAFTGAEGATNSPDLTVLADDILEGGVKQMCFQNSPFECLFVLRNDGVLCMFTYDRNTGISAWSRVEVGGEVESIATAPGDGQDYTYLVVKRTVLSTPTRHIERFSAYRKPDKKDWKYANDCMVVDFGHTAITKYEIDKAVVEGEFSSGTVFEADDTLPASVSVGDFVFYGSQQRIILSISGDDITIDTAFTGYEDITELTIGSGIITVTAASHGLSDADFVRIDGIKGKRNVGTHDAPVWIDADCELNGRVFRVADADTNTFTLQNENFKFIDGWDYAEYDGGGTVYNLSKTVTGLNHLAGRTCSIVADGGTQADKDVDNGGTVTIDRPANIVIVGLPYTSYIKTNRLVPQAMGEPKRINKVHIRFYRSLGCTVAKTLEEKGQDISFRENELNLESPGVYTGDKSILLIDEYNDDGYIYLIQREPLPFNICAVGIDYRVRGQ